MTVNKKAAISPVLAVDFEKSFTVSTSSEFKNDFDKTR